MGDLSEVFLGMHGRERFEPGLVELASPVVLLGLELNSFLLTLLERVASLLLRALLEGVLQCDEGYDSVHRHAVHDGLVLELLRALIHRPSGLK